MSITYFEVIFLKALLPSIPFYQTLLTSTEEVHGMNFMRILSYKFFLQHLPWSHKASSPLNTLVSSGSIMLFDLQSNLYTNSSSGRYWHVAVVKMQLYTKEMENHAPNDGRCRQVVVFGGITVFTLAHSTQLHQM